MGRPGKSSDLLSIVEHCYQPVESDDDWLRELFEVAAPALDMGGGLGLSLVREGPHGRAIALSRGHGRIADMLEASWPIIQQVDTETYRKFYYPSQPVLLASSLVSGFAAPLQQLFAGMMAGVGATDLLGMLGYPAPGWAFALFVSVGDAPISPQLRDTLRRLRIHVEASLRLRMFASSEAAAIIAPDGRLLHVSDDLLESASRDELGVQAAAIERARSASGRSDPHQAVGVWHALVEGRFSLVERTESDGKRAYHAFENAPHVQGHRALTDTESLVLSLSLQGLSGKEIAYTTGLSQSRISSALALAAERLGFAGREDLLAVGAHFLPMEDSKISADLTSAERAVLSLVRQGLSNLAIAKERSTSVHTVANQLSSLLRKTGASSRRALAVLAR